MLFQVDDNCVEFIVSQGLFLICKIRRKRKKSEITVFKLFILITRTQYLINFKRAVYHYVFFKKAHAFIFK